MRRGSRAARRSAAGGRLEPPPVGRRLPLRPSGRLPLGFLLLLGALPLPGCSDTTAPVAGELDARARAFESRGIRDYSFRYQLACTRCTQEEQELVRIRVQGGQVAGVERMASGESLPRARWGDWPTIPDLYGKLRDHARIRGNQLSVVYDDAWDVPVFASALVTGEVGGGFSFTVQDFTPE